MELVGVGVLALYLAGLLAALVWAEIEEAASRRERSPDTGRRTRPTPGTPPPAPVARPGPAAGRRARRLGEVERLVGPWPLVNDHLVRPWRPGRAAPAPTSTGAGAATSRRDPR